MTIKTTNYNTIYKYPINALVYIWDDKFTTYHHGEQLPFGKVVTPPTRRRKSLEIKVFTDIFELSY
jgi:hypothetical protein